MPGGGRHHYPADLHTLWLSAGTFILKVLIIPYFCLYRAIHDTGFRGAYSVEIFSGGVPDSLWEGDLAQLIRDNHTGLDTAWRAAFAEG